MAKVITKILHDPQVYIIITMLVRLSACQSVRPLAVSEMLITFEPHAIF